MLCHLLVVNLTLYIYRMLNTSFQLILSLAKLPNYDNFGRRTKLRLNPDNIPDLNWELATLANTISVTTDSYSTPKPDTIPVNTIIDVRPLVTS